MIVFKKREGFSLTQPVHKDSKEVIRKELTTVRKKRMD